MNDWRFWEIFHDFYYYLCMYIIFFLLIHPTHMFDLAKGNINNLFPITLFSRKILNVIKVMQF